MRKVNFNTDVEYEKEDDKKFKITRGKLILFGSLAFIIIVLIIILVISSQKAKKNNYKEEDFLLLERRMIEEAQIYVEQKQIVLSEKDYKIPLSELLDTAGGSIDSSKVKAAKICEGYVITKKIDMITYDAYLSCEDKYITYGYEVNKEEQEITTTAAQKDIEAPNIVLVGEKNITIKVGDTWKEPGYSAIDNVDKDITSKVVVSGNVNTAIIGEYTITYDVTDKAGNNSQQKRVVKVIGVATTTTKVNTTTTKVNTTTRTTQKTTSATTKITTETPKVPPTITLYGSKIINLKVGDSYKDPGYSATDCMGKNITSSVNVSGSVNTKVATTYYITYSVTDRFGNKATASRTIVVKPNNIPVEGITISPNAIVLQAGESKKLTVYITPSDATDKTLVWSSSNNSIATINNRTIYAKAKGVATITARTVNGKSYSVRVEVK